MFEEYERDNFYIPENKKFKVNSLTKDSISIKGINYVLLDFSYENIDMLNLRATENLAYTEIARVYGTSDKSCRNRILGMLQKMRFFERIEEIYTKW